MLGDFKSICVSQKSLLNQMASITSVQNGKKTEHDYKFTRCKTCIKTWCQHEEWKQNTEQNIRKIFTHQKRKHIHKWTKVFLFLKPTFWIGLSVYVTNCTIHSHSAFSYYNMWMRWAHLLSSFSQGFYCKFMVILRIRFSLLRLIVLLFVCVCTFCFRFFIRHPVSSSLIFRLLPNRTRIIQFEQINWNEKCRQCVKKRNWFLFLFLFFLLFFLRSQPKECTELGHLTLFFTSYAFLLASSCYRILISLCENHHHLRKYW